jgi:multiple sugar transport system ATP-binding protein
MRLELARLHRDLKATMIYVTHDQVEAMTMADRIVVLRAGVIEQVGTPLELYNNPANTFVAGFIGSPKMNLIPVKVISSDAAGTTVTLPLNTELKLTANKSSMAAGSPATLGIRPEGILFEESGPIVGEVSVVEHLGGETLAYVDIGEGVLVTVKSSGDDPVSVGQKVRLALRKRAPLLFDGQGQAVDWALSDQAA